MSDNQGSFISGLTVGFLAGAAGYFLFGTEKGKKIVHDLEKEWRAAQAADPQLTQAISRQATHQVNGSSLLKTIKDLVKQVADQQDLGFKQAKTINKNKKIPLRKAEPKFKGL